MEKQYSVQFFSSLVESIQKVCRDYLDFEQTVDLNGYLCLEIDSFKKERYVLSEIIQNPGNVISESYCTKAFKTTKRVPKENVSPHQHQAKFARLNESYQEEDGSTYPERNQIQPNIKNNANSFNLYHSSGRKRNSKPHLSRDTDRFYDDNKIAASNSYVPDHHTFTQSVPQQNYDYNTNASFSGDNALPRTNKMMHREDNNRIDSVHVSGHVKIKEEDGVAFMVLDDVEDFDGGDDNSNNYNNENNPYENNQNFETFPTTPTGDEFENAHTARKTKGHVKLFQEFLTFHNEMRPMLDIPPRELDALLGRFFTKVCKENGEDYEPNYLKNISSMLARHFRINNYCVSLRSEIFHPSRRLLEIKIASVMNKKSDPAQHPPKQDII